MIQVLDVRKSTFVTIRMISAHEMQFALTHLANVNMDISAMGRIAFKESKGQSGLNTVMTQIND